MTYYNALHVDSMWSGEMKSILLAGEKILIINMDGSFYAYEDKCSHKKIPLSKGLLLGNILTCHVHGWQYNVCTGKGENPKTACLKNYLVRIQNGELQINIESTLTMNTNTLDLVGPVLQNCEISRKIITAIKNQNAQVNVIDRGSYLRILVPGQCLVSKKEIEMQLGAPFFLPRELEAVMSSFKGKFTVTEEEAIWKFDSKQGNK